MNIIIVNASADLEPKDVKANLGRSEWDAADLVLVRYPGEVVPIKNRDGRVEDIHINHVSFKGA